jgi:hypothetical protein
MPLVEQELLSLPEHLSSKREEFVNNKRVIRIRISKRNRQHNGQKKKDKRTNNDLQILHRKLKINQHEPLSIEYLRT